MRKKTALTLLLLLALTLGGCRRASRQPDEASEVNLALEVDPHPPGVGLARLIITLTDAAGAPIDGATLEIRGDMSHAGMKPVLAEVSGGESGRYETPFEWTMGGDWIVTVTATLPDGRVTTRQFELTVMGAMNMEEDMPMMTETP